LEQEILAGRSITIVNKEKKFYSSAIVAGIIPIAVGVAIANKRVGNDEVVWCFIAIWQPKPVFLWKIINTLRILIYL
jgi:TPP-dependent pyruvate/acetoin dehydrogenase alpha subunit